MRQAGILAAAGIIALEKMVSRLSEDHANAQKLARGLSEIPGLGIDMSTVQSNMVAVEVKGVGMDEVEFSAFMKERGVLFNASLPYKVRMVTHHDVSSEDIDEAIERIKDALRG